MLPSTFEQVSSCDIWLYNKQYIIKHIYPKLNKRKIWDCSETQDVLNTYEILEKITFSSTSPVILTPINVSPEKFMILLPYMKMLNNNDILNHVYKIALQLKSFSKLSVTDESQGVSLVEYWKNLLSCINLLDMKKISSKIRELPCDIHTFLTNPNNFIGNVCIQYAQSSLGHSGFWGNEILFLPTYHWKYTQSGLDAGILLIDILIAKKYLSQTETLSILNCFSGIWEIPKKQILGWSLCICIENMICDTVFNGSKMSIITAIFSHLTNIFCVLI